MARNQRLPTVIELDREISKRSFAEFCKLVWHILEPAAPLKWGWALDAMCEHLEAVHRGEIKRLLINVPPGMMKSLLTGVFFPAWEWGPRNSPQLRYLTTAHKEALSVRDNLKCRRLIQSEWFQERWPVILTGDQNAKTKFENVNTGFRESMAFTSLTGSRGDRIIIDDPLSVDDAFSPAALLNAETTFLEAVPSRVNNENSAIVVIMQRLHERDTSGIILGRDLGYEYLMLPMEFEPQRACVTSIGFRDPRKTQGELLFPERFPENQVKELKRTMGEYASAGQLQQRPVPRGGGMFKAEWFKYWTDSSLPPEFEQVITSWDMTFKDSKNSDYVVGQVWGKNGANFYLLDQVRGQWDFVKTREMFLILAQKWPQALRKLVEDKANGSAIISELQKTVSGIVPITPKESKEARASAITPFFEAGNVYLPDPKKTPWMGAFEAELLSFPAGAHDDQCFVAGTMVATLLGDKPIERIKAGEMVITPFGLKRVLFSGKTGTRGVISKFGLTATPEHPFITRKAEIKTFKTVKEEECIKLKYRNLINPILRRRLYSTALPIVSWERESTTLASPQQIKVGKLREDFTSLFGSSFRGKKFLKDSKSIIRTAILSIMNLAILSVYHGANIARKLISKRKELKNIWMRFGRLLVLGIEVKKDVCGTKNTQKTRYERTINASAHIAESFLLPSKSGESFVKEVAKPNIDGNTRAIWSPRSVKFAAKNLQALKEGVVSQEQLVLDHAVESLDGKELPVYNLQIEDAHMFFANECLVHNCDSLSQALNYFRNNSTYILSKDVLKALKRPPRF